MRPISLAVRVVSFLAFLLFSTSLAAQSADLSITKTDSPDPVTAGSEITYTITLVNAGPDPAANLFVTDGLPAQSTFVSFSAPPGFSVTTPAVGATGSVTASIPSFSGLAVFTLVVRANPNLANGATLFNTVQTGSGTADPNPANNNETVTTAVVTSADLSITKTDSPDPITAGTNLTYTITATNPGPSNSQNVTVTDTLPAGTTFVSATQTSGPAMTITTPAVGASGTFSATASPFAAGTTATFELVVAVDDSVTAGSVITNTARIQAPVTFDPDLANNEHTITTNVLTSADLGLTKTDSPDPAQAGGNISYTLTLSNAGPSAAAVVTLTDALPAGTTFVSATQTSGPSFSLTTPAVGATGTVTATAGALGSGAVATFTIVVSVDPALPGGTVLSNTATVTSSTPDPNDGDNAATQTTTVTGAPDLVVTKTDTADPVTAGDTLTYVVTLENAGASASQNVALSDAIPANTTFVSFTQTSGPTFTITTPAAGGGGTVTATVPSFAAGAAASFSLVVDVDAATAAGTTITNTANVSSDTGDANAANDSDTETTLVVAPTADLSVSKTVVGTGPFTAGSNVTFTITIANAGPDAATNVVATDTLPAGATLVSATPSQGTCGSGAPVVCSVGTLASGAAATITIVMQTSVTPGAQVNSVTVTANEIDPDGVNNAQTAPFTTVAAVAAAAIPTLAEWMLLLLAAAIAAAGVKVATR